MTKAKFKFKIGDEVIVRRGKAQRKISGRLLRAYCVTPLGELAWVVQTSTGTGLWRESEMERTKP